MKTCWLIEVSADQWQNVFYFCGPGDWCNNLAHAMKFQTKELAERTNKDLHTIGERRVAEHSWV